jgi:hypothetical protein
MRRVRFDLRDRAILVPVEVTNSLIWAIPVPIILFIVGGIWFSILALTIFLAGVVLFPLLLPYLPTKEFASKGMFLGIIAGLIVGTAQLSSTDWSQDPLAFGCLIVYPLLVSPLVGFVTLNFTGASTYTSRTGVRKEIFRFIPIIVLMFFSGLALLTVLSVAKAVGW